MVAQRSADDAHTTESESDADRSIDDAPLPPGPDSYPIVGNTLDLVRDPFGFYDTLAPYGDVVQYQVAGDRFTTLLHPDYVERVLVEEPDRFERYLFGDQGFDFAPEGVLMTDGEQWRRQRTLMQPAFTMDRIRSYADTMADYAKRTGDTWTDGQVVTVNGAFSNLTLRILSSALFDVDVDPAAEDAAITRAARVINERGDTRNLSVFLPSWVPTPMNRRYKRALRDYRTQINSLIDRRREKRETATAADAAADDLLTLLLTAEGPDGTTLSEAEVRDNLITFTFAGHETTSLGLTYTILLLAQHDDVAARLRSELETVLDGDQPGFADVPRLEYTERVIREAMRLYPPAYILFRKATEDAVIGGYRIPEGTIVTLPQFHIHTDDRFYDDPDAFRPDRWTEERAADRPEYAYFPFGGGPRHCIGMRFAMLEMQLVVATIAQRFEFELLSDPDPELAAGATLQPDEDVRVRVHRRYEADAPTLEVGEEADNR